MSLSQSQHSSNMSRNLDLSQSVSTRTRTSRKTSKTQTSASKPTSSKPKSELISKYFAKTDLQTSEKLTSQSSNKTDCQSAFDDSADDFRSPLLLRKRDNSSAWKLNKNPVKQSSANAKKGGSKKKKVTKNSTIEIIKDNFENNNANPEHLQMAIALSKSSFEAEYAQSSKSQETVNDNPDISAILQNVKPTSLEQFGFKSCRDVLPVVNRRIPRATELSKKIKNRFKYITPILSIRTNEEREKLIDAKIFQILCMLSTTSKCKPDYCLSSTKLRNCLPKERHIFSLDEIYDKNCFEVASLGLSKNRVKCGSLLKDWSTILGRDKSPSKSDFTSMELNASGHEKCNNKKVGKASSSSSASPEPADSGIASLSKQASCGSLSPDLFGSDDELPHNSPVKTETEIDTEREIIEILDSSDDGTRDIPLTRQNKSKSSRPASFYSLDEYENNEAGTINNGNNNSGTNNKESVNQSQIIIDTLGEEFSNRLKEKEMENIPYYITDYMNNILPEYNKEKQHNVGNLSQGNQEASLLKNLISVPTKDIDNKESNETVSNKSEIHETYSPGAGFQSMQENFLVDNNCKDNDSNLSPVSTKSYASLRVTSLNVEEFELPIDDSPKAHYSLPTPKDCPISPPQDVSHFRQSDEPFFDPQLPALNKTPLRFSDRKTSVSSESENGFSKLNLYQPKSRETGQNITCIELSTDDSSSEESRDGGLTQNITQCRTELATSPLATPLDDHGLSVLRPSRGYNSADLNVTDYVNELLNKDNYSFEDCEMNVDDMIAEKEGDEELLQSSQGSQGSCIEDEELNYSSNFMTPLRPRQWRRENGSLDDEISSESCAEVHEDHHDVRYNVPSPIPQKCISSTSQATPKIVNTPENYIIKTRNVTPLPDFDSMNTPLISKELDKIGVKPLKRARGAQLLKYIYDSTHPIVDSDEEEKIVKKRKKVHRKIELDGPTCDLDSGAPHTLKMQENSSAIDIIGDRLLKDEKLENLIFERRQSAKIPSCRVPLQIIWHNFLSSNPEIKEKVLLYEPLQLEALHGMLKQFGFKFHIQDLLTFLDKKCITIRTTQKLPNR